jgi:hypothetical protein
MPARRDLPDDRPNIGTTPFLEGLQALEGEEMPEDQDAVLDLDEVEHRRRPTQTELDRLDPDMASDEDAVGIDGFGGVDVGGLREEETDDPEVAAQEGIPWVPPVDPPLVAADWPGVAAVDEAYEVDSGDVRASKERDLHERIREALRSDIATSRLTDLLVIRVVGSTAIIRGTVDDIDDSDAIVAIVERVPGVEEVRDETVFPGL